MSTALEELYQQHGLKNPLDTVEEPEITSFTSTAAPTREDLGRIAEMDYNIKEHNALMGVVAGAGVEIGSGLGLTMLNHARRARKIRMAAMAATVAPEPTSTVVGLVGLAATEAAIWGFSNYLGQSTRKAMGMQDHYSGGELLASSVFGIGVVGTKALQGTSKLFELAPSIKSLGGWKSLPVAREGAKTFVSGAGLGFAESLLRQEVQIMLNERETRDVVDYAVSGAFGGSFNTVFSIFGRTGLWGLNKAIKASDNALVLARQALDRAQKIKNPRKRRKEIQKIQEGIRHLEEVNAGFKDASKIETETNAKAEEGAQLENNGGDPRQAPELKPQSKPQEENLKPEPEPTPEPTAASTPDPKTPKETPEALYEFGNGDPIPVNSDGTITLYHRTNANPDEIKKSGGFISKENTDEIFVSTKRDGQNEGYGENVVELKVKQDDLEIDDLFDDEAHFRVSIKKANQALEAPATPKETPEAPEFTIEIDKNPRYDGPNGNYKKFLGYKVRAKDGKDYYIETANSEQPSNSRFVVHEGSDMHGEWIGSFPTKKEAVEFLQSKKAKAPATPKDAPEPTPEPEPTPKPEPSPETSKSERRARIDEFNRRLEGVNRENFVTLEPELSRISTRLSEELEPEFELRVEELSMKYNKGEELTDADLDELLNIISDLRALNEGRDALRTTFGRQGQAFQGDSDKYVWETSVSIRAIRENVALMDLEQSLLALKRGEQEDVLLKQLDEYVSPKDEVNESKPKSPVKDSDESQPSGKDSDEKPSFESLSPTQQASAITKATATAIRTRIEKLNKELNKQRSLMMDGMDEAMNEEQRNALKEEVAKRVKNNPTIKTLNEKIKYYKQAAKDAEDIEKLQKELERLAAIEGEGVVSQLKDETTKPTTKTGVEDAAPKKTDELKRKIRESKARMRDKLRDLERVEKESKNLDVFFAMQNHAMREMDTQFASRAEMWVRDLRTARKLALIDQLPSVFAGVPTGVGLALKSAMRPFVMAPLDLSRYGADTATKLLIAELHGLATSILNWNGTMTSMGRTFIRGNSATDRVMGKYMEDAQSASYRTGGRIDVDRAVATAQARMRGKRDPMLNPMDLKNDGYWAVLSLGVRGIAAIDDGFRRQLLRGRLQTAARRKAILENPNNPKAQEEAYQKSIKTMWGKNGGIDVLRNYKEFIEDVNEINQNLLFAAQMDNPEMFHQNFGEKLIKMFGDQVGKDNSLAFIIDAFLPYISVPVRGVYRGARFALAPAVAGRALLRNPYQVKIDKKRAAIETNEVGMLTKRGQQGFDENDPEFLAMVEKSKNLRNDIEILEGRKTKYLEEAMTDLAFGGTLMALGFLGAMYGQATGSLNWMTRDQKEKNKLTSFKLFGMDYSAAQPWSIPIAIGADIASYYQAKQAGALNEKQNPVLMMTSTLVELSEQVPMFEGFKTFNSIVGGGLDTKIRQLNRLGATYVPIPAQIRKVVMAASEDQTIGDLRGGTFAQRQAYAFFGIKPVNKKTDFFGEDVLSDKSWVQHAIIRQAPTPMPEFQNEFERILASDVYDNIQSPPSTLGSKIKMINFVDKEGMTLQYAYALRLRDFKMVYKGKRQTLKQAVDRLVKSRAWRKKYEKAQVSESLTVTNEGLMELNRLMQKYYLELRKDIIKDDSFTKSFVNDDDGTLYDVINREATEIQGVTAPIRELLNFN